MHACVQAGVRDSKRQHIHTHTHTATAAPHQLRLLLLLCLPAPLLALPLLLVMTMGVMLCCVDHLRRRLGAVGATLTAADVAARSVDGGGGGGKG